MSTTPLLERAKEFASQLKATAYPTLDALLENVDASYTRTFPQAHAEGTIRWRLRRVALKIFHAVIKSPREGVVVPTV